jgi:lysophospholipase L1-like esterase
MFFGDDLMYGTVAQGKKEGRLRIPWPERLRERLVNEAGLRLVMGGLPGRTSRWDDAELATKTGEWCKPFDFNGLYHFGTAFSSHTPLWVVIALGTNDLKLAIRKEAVRVMTEQSSSFTFRQDLSSTELDELKLAAKESNGLIPTDDEAPKSRFNADTIARSVGSIALKARRLFKGHCHEGTLKILLVVPPVIHLTAYAMRQGFDADSVKLSQLLPEAFDRMAKDWNLSLIKVPSFQNHTWPDGIHPSEQASEELAELCWERISTELPRRQRKRVHH